MKTKEEMALKIATLEGWNPTNARKTIYENEGMDLSLRIEDLVKKYSSFDWLIPIVFRINQDRNGYSIIINVDVQVHFNERFIFGECGGEAFPDSNVQHVQKAIIAYYKHKESRNA